MPIEITPSVERLAVDLKLDFADYCASYKAKDTALYTKLRRSWVSQLTGLMGELHWECVKKELAKQCDPSNSEEAELKAFLTAGGSERLPLVIEGLNGLCKELLKNSIDALLLRHFKGSDKTKLEMTITIKLEAGKLIVVIKDNAGGFSDEFLEAFLRDSRAGDYKSCSSSKDKRELVDYCFGGRGLGMQSLFEYIKYGGIRERASSPALSIQYDIPAGSTGFLIRNNDGGAEITLSSPLKPFPRVEHRSSAIPAPFTFIKDPRTAPKTAAVEVGSPAGASVRSNSTVSPGMAFMAPDLLVDVLELPPGAFSITPVPFGFFTNPVVTGELNSHTGVKRLRGEDEAATGGEGGVAQASACERKFGAI